MGTLIDCSITDHAGEWAAPWYVKLLIEQLQPGPVEVMQCNITATSVCHSLQPGLFIQWISKSLDLSIFQVC